MATPITDPEKLAKFKPAPVTDPEALARFVPADAPAPGPFAREPRLSMGLDLSSMPQVGPLAGAGGQMMDRYGDHAALSPKTESSFRPDMGSPLARGVGSFIDEISLRTSGIPEAVYGDYGPPQSNMEILAEGAGRGLGMLPALSALGGAAAPLAGAAAPVAFGAYEGLMPAESLGQRAENATRGLALGALLGPVAQASPAVRGLTATRPGRFGFDVAAMTGLGAAEGAPLREALLSSIGTAGAFQAGHPVSGIERMAAEMRGGGGTAGNVLDGGGAFPWVHGTTKDIAQVISRDGFADPNTVRRKYTYSEYGPDAIYGSVPGGDWTKPGDARRIGYDEFVEFGPKPGARVEVVDTPRQADGLARRAGFNDWDDMASAMFVDMSSKGAAAETASSRAAAERVKAVADVIQIGEGMADKTYPQVVVLNRDAVITRPQTERVSLAELTGRPAAGNEMIDVPKGFAAEYRAAQAAPEQGRGDPAKFTPEFVDANYPPTRENAPLEMRRPDVAPQNVTDVTGRRGRMLSDADVRTVAKGQERGPDGAAKGLEPSEWDAAVAKHGEFAPPTAADTKTMKMQDLLKAMDGASTDPVRGVATTEGYSLYNKGRVDELGMAEWYKQNADRMTGNVTPSSVEAGRARVLSEKNPKMTPEELGAAVKNELPASEEALARKHALEATIPDELRTEIIMGRLLDKTPSQYTDPRRHLQHIGGQKLGSPGERHTLRLMEQAERTKVQVKANTDKALDAIAKGSGLKRGSSDYGRFGEMVKLVSSGETADAVRAKPEYAEVAARFKNPEAVLGAAVEARRLLDARNQAESSMHEAFGKKPVGYLENYWPSVEAGAKWYDVPGRVKGLFAGGESVGRGDPRPSVQQFNPRHLRRAGSVERENLSFDALYGYADRHAKTMAHTPVITAMDGVARYIKNVSGEKVATAAGEVQVPQYKNLPYTLEAITGSKFSNRRFGKAGEEQTHAAASKAYRAWLKTQMKWKGYFNRSTYEFNLAFNALTQWTSTFLGTAMFPEHAIPATLDVWNPRLRGLFDRAARNNPNVIKLHDKSYAGYMKNAPDNRMGREGMVDEFAGGRETAVGEAVGKAGNILTKTIERETGIYSYALAVRVGKQRGWTPEQIDAFASDLIAGTQSMYDNYNRAEILKSISRNFYFPAQSYGVETVNFARQALGRTGNTYVSKRRGVGAIASYIAMYMTWEYLKTQAFGQSRIDFDKFRPLKDTMAGDKDFTPRDLFTASEGVMETAGLLPFVGSYTGTDIGEGKMRTAQLVEDFYKAADNISNAWESGDKGDIDQMQREMAMAYARVARMMMRGGTAQYKAISTEKMVQEGKIPEGSEQALGWMLGPYSTPTLAEETKRRKARSGSSSKGKPPRPYIPRR